MIRADGKKLYAESGGLPGAALPQLLLATLRQAGRTFSDAETKLLAETVPAAEQAFGGGAFPRTGRDPQALGGGDRQANPIAAAAALQPLKPLGKLGDFQSYSELALRADQLAQKIAASGKELLTTAEAELKAVDSPEGAHGADQLEHALTLVSAAEAFEAFPELNATATQALRNAERNDAISSLLSQARALLRARRYAKLESARLKRSAIRVYGQIVQRYPDAMVAEIARQELALLDPNSPALSPAPNSEPEASPNDGFRTWTDDTGKYKTVAQQQVAGDQNGHVPTVEGGHHQCNHWIPIECQCPIRSGAGPAGSHKIETDWRNPHG